MKPTLYKEITGWCNYEPLYDKIYEEMPEGGKFLEVGLFMGKSIAYMAELVKLGTKNFTIYGIDHFKGSDEPLHHQMLQGVSLADIYYQNIAAAQLHHIITLKTDSENGSLLFADESLDAVFIDAGHTFDDVYSDINRWLPKVKPYGTLAGHDYYGSHPGVKLAVDRYFDGTPWKVSSAIETECWWIVK
jgi:hypothetical protein